MSGKSGQVEHEKSFLFTLAGMQFSCTLDFMIMVPLGPQLMRQLQIDTTGFGLLISCYAFSAALSSTLAAGVIDRFERRRFFLVLYALFMLAALACASAQNFWALLIARCFAGAFGGMADAMVHTFLADTIPFARRGVATGYIAGAFSMSTVVGVPVGLMLSNTLPALGWRAPFFLLTLICAVFLLLAYLNLPILREHMSQKRLSFQQNIRAILRIPVLRLALLVVVLIAFGGFLVMPFVPLYLINNVKVSESFLPIMYGCAGVVTLFTARQIGHLADRYGKRTMFRALSVCACLPILFATHMQVVALSIVLLNSIALFVLIPGRMIAGMAFLSGLPPVEQRGSFMSLVAAVQMLAIGCSALICGWITERGPQGQILYFSYVGYLALACALLGVYLTGRLHVPDSVRAVQMK